MFTNGKVSPVVADRFDLGEHWETSFPLPVTSAPSIIFQSPSTKSTRRASIEERKLLSVACLLSIRGALVLELQLLLAS